MKTLPPEYLEVDESEVPLIFVYLGAPLPKYARHSLEIARRQFVGPIFLLTDQSSVVLPKGVFHSQIKDFYDRERFSEFERKSPLDPLFRRKFWLSAVERFFVLEQFTRFLGYRRFFHAELDVMILNLAGVAAACDQEGLGLFAPVENENRAIASVMYFNSPSSLKSLVEFIEEHPEIGNEMKILGHFMFQNRNTAFALQGDRIFDSKWPYGLSFVGGKHPLIDSSGFGQWLLGQDPRNLIGTSWNLHKGAMEFPIEGLHFSSNLRGQHLSVGDNKQSFRTIGALHIHSKAFRRLRLPGALFLYSIFATKNWKLPVQISFSKLATNSCRLLLKDSASQKLSLLPRPLKESARVLIGRLVKTDKATMSNRERRNYNLLLPNISHTAKGLLIPCVTASELVPLPDTWATMFTEFRPEVRQRILLEAQFLYGAMFLKRPHFVHYSEVACSAHKNLVVPDNRVSLLHSSEKGFEEARHAASFWDLPRIAPWSYMTRGQILQPEIVQEMFSSENQILEWIELGFVSKRLSVSAFQSYGNWVYWNRPKQVNNAYMREFDGA